MASLLTINVINNSSSTQSFYVFQQPAMFTGGAQVYSNSLFSSSLGSYPSTGSMLTFQAQQQPYAAIQQAPTYPMVGQSSGFATAVRPIDLAPAGGGSANDWTTASVNPLGLSRAASSPGIQPGTFRITTPVYSPPAIYNIGSAVETNGLAMVSSFVVANPASNTDCQPIPKFYVQTGIYTPGLVLNFSQSSVNAAVCDFSGGQTTMNVTYNMDGTWTVQTRQ